MKKFAVILSIILCAFSLNAWAEYENQNLSDENNEIRGKCGDMIIPLKEFEGYLGQVLGDQHIAGRVMWCFSDKIKQHSSSQQFELYKKAKIQAEEFLDDLLYYKGNLNYTYRSELMYRYQSYVYYALTQDNDFMISGLDDIDCELNDKITMVPICLKQDILKICNIESRRRVVTDFDNLTNTTMELLKTITEDEKNLKNKMQQYFNMISHLVSLIRESDLMNPHNSWNYMSDLYIYEEMHGQEHLEAEELKKPYPLPFP